MYVGLNIPIQRNIHEYVTYYYAVHCVLYRNSRTNQIEVPNFLDILVFLASRMIISQVNAEQMRVNASKSKCWHTIFGDEFLLDHKFVFVYKKKQLTIFADQF